MTKSSKRRRSKKRRPGFFQKNRLLLVFLGLTGLAVLGLVLIARFETPQSLQPVPTSIPATDYTKQLFTEVDAFLAAIKADAENLQRDDGHMPARYTITGEFPSDEAVTSFARRVEKIPGDYSVRFRQANSLTVEKSRQTIIILHFIPPAELVPAVPPGPLVTIIMDDLGRSTYTAEALIALSQPVTFAILPDEPQAVQVAELAFAAGHEVMLHTPMEPQGYPAVNPGENALFVKYSQQEIRRRFEHFLEKIPHVSGTNNHMGSRFTEDARALEPVMESLRERGLFFVDSRTTGHTRGPEVARRYGVRTMDRDVFLDNVANVKAIGAEIVRLEKLARKKGMAIGICHPYPETLEALRRQLPGLAERGVTIVPVSVLLRKRAESQGS